MGIIAWIMIGLIAGWLGTHHPRRHAAAILGNLAVGLVGAIVGGFLFDQATYLHVDAGFLGQPDHSPPSAPWFFC